jgi:hypothetical protein
MERFFERLLFATRWLLAPIYLGGSSSRRVTQPSASIELFRDLGFHADGYIATCNKFSNSSCSGVGVLFW